MISCNNKCAIVFFNAANPGIYERRILTADEYFALTNRGSLNLKYLLPVVNNQFFHFLPNNTYTLRLISNVQSNGNGLVECNREDSTERQIVVYNCDDLTACCLEEDTSVVNQQLVSRLKESNIYKVVPNPAQDLINISLFGTEKELKIFNLDGVGIYHTSKLDEQAISIDISKFNSGIYYIQIHFKDEINNIYLPFVKYD